MLSIRHALLAFAVFLVLTDGLRADDSRVKKMTNNEKGVTEIVVDGKTVLNYRHGNDVDLPHFYPWNSPSGRSMTVQCTVPYAHHRSFWIGEQTVFLEGTEEKLSNYFGYQSGAPDPNKEKIGDGLKRVAPFKSRTRHVGFTNEKQSADSLEFEENLVWEFKEKPYAEERRHYRFVALDDGEYFLDLTFNVTAAYGKLSITCDQSHYAWPLIRMNDDFNAEKGNGVLTNSEGKTGQKGTNMKPALWVDYSAPADDGKFEGLACFLHPSQNPPVLWLTRDYGTWGPRRDPSKHQTTFEIPKGESYGQRIGLLIHRGNADTGEVSKRYATYCEGAL